MKLLTIRNIDDFCYISCIYGAVNLSLNVAEMFLFYFK